MTPVPKTTYARNGDVHIAYEVVGDGPLDLVLIPGFVSHVDYICFPGQSALANRHAEGSS